MTAAPDADLAPLRATCLNCGMDIGRPERLDFPAQWLHIHSLSPDCAALSIDDEDA